jgi:RHS repeat-associated protein
MYTGHTITGRPGGIYHAGARFYSADLGRFLSADSIVPGAGNPQLLNRYAYVANNPLRYTDPTGNCAPGIGACPDQESGYASAWKPASQMPTGGPAAPNFAPCFGGAACTTIDGIPYYSLAMNGTLFAAWVRYAALAALVGVDAVNPYSYAFDAAAFVGSCVAGACDYAYGIGVAPFLSGSVIKAARLSAKVDGRQLSTLVQITDDGALHATVRHWAGARNASQFYRNEDLTDLVRGAELTLGRPSSRDPNNIERIVDAGRDIGINRATGRPTSIYTVVTTQVGDLVTMHPGLP